MAETDPDALAGGQRGWTPQRYERFLRDTRQRLLLADEHGGLACRPGFRRIRGISGMMATPGPGSRVLA